MQDSASTLAETSEAKEESEKLPSAYLQDVSFRLTPMNQVRNQESVNHLLAMGVDEDILKEIGEGDYNHLRAIPQNALSYIKNNAENLVLIYDD